MSQMRYLGLLVFSLHMVYATCSLADEQFSSIWLDALRQDSINAGISSSTVDATLQQLTLLPKVIALDRAQPEFISPFLDYYRQHVDKLNIKRGREQLIAHEALLILLEQQYGVPASQLIAFWGMETNYGRQQGGVDTFSALATLAYDGRRADFFRAQLQDAMRMVDSEHGEVGQLQGSWAGAFGHMQFMPTTFMTFAEDGDNDGVIDVVNSVPDAFCSAANYLSQVGWHQDELVMLEVQLPDNFDWNSAQINLKKSIADWLALGVKAVAVASSQKAIVQHTTVAEKLVPPKSKTNRAAKSLAKRQSQNMAKLSAHNTQSLSIDMATTAHLHMPASDAQAAILLPQGWRGPAFMVFDNFYAILDWNRSVNYALTVAQLAKQINLEPAVQGGEYADGGALSYQQMFELQTILNARGFAAGEPDGFPGIETQAAIRAYQRSTNIPADGYASPSLFARLKSPDADTLKSGLGEPAK